MKRFAELCAILESTANAREKMAALTVYFQDAPPPDAIWAIRLLLGWKPSRIATSQTLRRWARECVQFPDWLFEESCAAVGNLLETLALLIPLPDTPGDVPLHVRMQRDLLPLRDLTENEQRAAVSAAWTQMDAQQRFVWNTLLTGGFRPHVSEKTLIRALSAWRGLPTTVLACRLKQEWEPTVAGYRALFSHDIAALDSSQLYPFQRWYEEPPARGASGAIGDWRIDWHRNGMRAQLIKRGSSVFLWSDDHVIVNDTFPEICEAMAAMTDGTVLDGVITAWSADGPLHRAELERRMKRKRLTKKFKHEVPVRYWVYDLLEIQGEDVRTQPFRQRIHQAAGIIPTEVGSVIHLAEPLEAASWHRLHALRNDARRHGADGVLLRRWTASACPSTRKADQWRVWKADPLTAPVVLVYVQALNAASGQRSVEGTFAAWDGGDLVPVAKTSAGFSDEDVNAIEEFAKQHTVERFGPVRSLKAELVFTLAFDSVSLSTRRKSGLVLHHPRVAGRLLDASIHDAERIAILRNRGE